MCCLIRTAEDPKHGDRWVMRRSGMMNRRRKLEKLGEAVAPITFATNLTRRNPGCETDLRFVSNLYEQCRNFEKGM
jgi:hypothetical protein